MGDFKRYCVRHGDTTTTGGVVQASGHHMPIDGKSVAMEGDAVTCPACKSTGVIRCVPPMRRITGQAGKQLSTDGDLCMCNCTEPPRLIASQDSYGVGFGADEVV